MVIPAFNEEAAISGVVLDLLGVLRPSSVDFELIVVDDASTDSTAAVLRRLQQQVPELRVVTHDVNRGWAGTSRSGIAAARGAVIAHFAGDGEASAADLPRLLETLHRGADIVLGVRRNLDYSPLRRLQHDAQRLLVKLLFDLDLEDAGGPKAARASIWKQLPSSYGSATFMTERLVVARQSGVAIATVDVSHRWRSSGRSAFSSPRASMLALRDLLRLRLSKRSHARLRFDATARQQLEPQPPLACDSP